MNLKTLKMVKKLKKWVEGIEKRRIDRDINVRVHGIKVSVRELPYFKQVEVVKNILESLENKEKLLLKEVESIKQSKQQIKEL